jgi:hypothetical protein
MCNFFSFCTDEFGKKYYFDWKARKELLPDYEGRCDSHSGIAKKFGLREDSLNKFEFNPLTGKFTVDQINSSVDNSLQAEDWVRKLDFSKVVQPLIIKEIVNPLLLPIVRNPSKAQISYLKDWNSVWDSVRNSVRNSVGDSVWDSVWDSVRNSVWDSVRNSVWDSVGDSVRNSVWESVWDSVLDSVYCYIGSFINTKYNIDITPSNKLWEAGLVPSFDGTLWRLHSGKNANIVYTWNPKEKI